MQPHNTQRNGKRRHGKVAVAGGRTELWRISAEHPRADYRTATALLRRAGMEVNIKHVQRLCRQE